MELGNEKRKEETWLVIVKKRLKAEDYVAIGHLSGLKGLRIALDFVGLEIWFTDGYGLLKLIDRQGRRTDSMRIRKTLVSPSSYRDGIVIATISH